MKIEMGESLFYSWLRHVKECQIVQTNWKISSQWNLKHESELQNILDRESRHFEILRGYKIFKQNASLSQILQQGECDVLGISVQDGSYCYYAVDVAFHEAGLNYGSKEETVMKVIAKSIRTALCLYGYFDTKEAEIIFASPKINPAIMQELSPCLDDINKSFDDMGFCFRFRLIANSDFNSSVLQPILLASNGIADTSELFVRSYQMYKMFANEAHTASRGNSTQSKSVPRNDDYSVTSDSYGEFKVGKLAQLVLGKMLEEGKASLEEVQFMQTANYSKQFFGLNYPLLARVDSVCDPVRYYAKPLTIYGVEYKLCSQWFETPANNDRPYLLKWIQDHT